VVRFLDIKIEECDKLPTTLCQPCTSKIEELQCFYHHCQDAQKILAVQHGVQIQDERVIENEALIVASNENNITDKVVKEDTTDAIPITTTSTTTLSADKLLETAIKDTCILSGEDSEESGEDSEESLSDDENQTDDQSATEDKVCV
jgi:hypothetical protein